MNRYYTKPIDLIEPSDFTELVRLALSELQKQTGFYIKTNRFEQKK